MSSPPRTRPSTVALTAIAIGVLVLGAVVVAVIAGVDVIKYGETFVTGLYPPRRSPTQGQAVRDLYTIVFLIAVAIFFVVEGLILWSVIRYHRKPGDDTLPPQTHGNNVAEAVWTIVPTLIVAFLFIISWQTLNVVDATSAKAADATLHAQAGQFQWTFDYLDADGKRPVHPVRAGRPGRRPQRPDRTDDRADPRTATTSSTRSTCRSSCSSATSCRVGPTSSSSTCSESMAGQTFRGQCAELCGSGHDIMTFDVHAMTGADFDAWLAAKVAEAAAHRRPPPPRRPRAPPHDHRVRSHEDRLNGDDHAASGRDGLQERPVRLGDDDRSQEDRDHVRHQLVHLLLHRRDPGPGRPERTGDAGPAVRDERQTYNELFTMHATFMIFLFVIPMLAGFGNYVVPLQIGAPDMAFPRINALSLWMLPLAGVLLLSGFVTGGTAAAGWTSYAPLSEDYPAVVAGRRPGPVDRGADPHRDQLDPGRDQLHRDDLQDARARA